MDRSAFIYDEVKRAQGNLVLTNDLHLLYLVTTPEMITDVKPNYQTYLKQVMKLLKCYTLFIVIEKLEGPCISEYVQISVLLYIYLQAMQL